jgi:hypothetical protein
MEISMDVPQKTKDRSTYGPAIPVLDTYLKECKHTTERSAHHIYVALLTTVKLWNQPTCPPTNELEKKWYVYTMALYRHKEEGNYVVCRKTIGTGHLKTE